MEISIYKARQDQPYKALLCLAYWFQDRQLHRIAHITYLLAQKVNIFGNQQGIKESESRNAG
jgi:hypothetical protein